MVAGALNPNVHVVQSGEIRALGPERARAAVWAYPTDTVWGIGAWAHNVQAHRVIAGIKGTAAGKPLSLLFGGHDHWKGAARWPAHLSGDWARRFFSLGTSLAAPKEWFLQRYPEEVVGREPSLSTRCLDFPFVLDLAGTLDGPLTTTSLNYTGTPPVRDLQEALEFLHTRPAEVLEGLEVLVVDEPGVRPSGQASSMLCLSVQGGWEWWRKGAQADAVQDLIDSLA